MADLRVNLRNYYFKETGKVPDEDLAMYTDWLELQIIGPPYSPPPEEVITPQGRGIRMASGLIFPSDIML